MKRSIFAHFFCALFFLILNIAACADNYNSDRYFATASSANSGKSNTSKPNSDRFDFLRDPYVHSVDYRMYVRQANKQKVPRPSAVQSGLAASGQTISGTSKSHAVIVDSWFIQSLRNHTIAELESMKSHIHADLIAHTVECEKVHAKLIKAEYNHRQLTDRFQHLTNQFFFVRAFSKKKIQKAASAVRASHYNVLVLKKRKESLTQQILCAQAQLAAVENQCEQVRRKIAAEQEALQALEACKSKMLDECGIRDNYALSCNGQRILEECGFDSEKIVHRSQMPENEQVQREFIDIVERCADMRYAYNELDNFRFNVTGAIVDCVDVGIDFAHQGEIDKAFIISDFCDAALNFGMAVIQGGVDAAYVSCKVSSAAGRGVVKGLKKAGHGFIDLGNLAVDAALLAHHVVRDPSQAAQKVYTASVQFCRAMEYVRKHVLGIEFLAPGKTVTIGSDRVMYITFNNAIPGIRLSPTAQVQAYAFAKDAVRSAINYVGNNPYEAIEEGIAVGVDCVASGLIMNAVAKGVVHVYAVGKNAVQLEKTSQMLDKVRKETGFRFVGVTTEGVKLQHSPMMHFMESADDAVNKANSRALTQVIQKAEQSGQKAVITTRAGGKVCKDFLNDFNKIKNFEEHLKTIPGAMLNDGPFMRIDTYLREKIPGQLGMARGSLYELETVLKVEQKGEKLFV